MSDSNNCRACRFFRPSRKTGMFAKKGSLGECRRNPPTVTQQLATGLKLVSTEPVTTWPIVPHDAWCGELRER